MRYTSSTYGATPEEWAHFELVLGLGEDLLPTVCDPSVAPSPRSAIKEHGRTPSLINHNGQMTGIPKWTQVRANGELKQWSRDLRLGICLQTRHVRGIDIDVPDATRAQYIADTASMILGIKLPVRRRQNTGKRLLAVIVKGDIPKRSIRVGEKEQVEFLGNGQMFVAAGTRKDGSRYYWEDGLPGAIPEITPEHYDELVEALTAEFAVAPARTATAGERRKGPDIDIDDPVANWLYDQSLVLGQTHSGALMVECPWDHEHTSGERGDSSTVWFPAGTNGHPTGHFKCMHGHCDGRNRSDFLEAVEFPDDRADDFVDMGPSPEKDERASEGDTEAEYQDKPEAISEIEPTAFEWIDPASIPRRQWLYGRHLIRRFVSATVSPGGIGKSSLEIVDALAMVTGRSLLDATPIGKLKVWVWNGEDPLEELQRRVAAACLHYGITRDEVEGRLFLDSGRDKAIVLAEETRDGTKIAKPLVKALIAAIRERGIDCLVIDPFVSSHRVSENDNNAIDRVVKIWARIANVTNCAISLVHHSRKTGGAEVSAEDARGASALVSGARSVRTLNPMSEAEAAKAGITGNRRLYFYTDASLGKANLAPPADKRTWYHLTNVALGNNDGLNDGDHVGVVTRWEWSPASDKVSATTLRRVQELVRSGGYRKSDRAVDDPWVGHAVAEVMALDISDRGVKATIRSLLKDWFRDGYLTEIFRANGHRNKKLYVSVGRWAEEDADLGVKEAA